MRGYELTDFEWQVIAPLLPNNPRGVLRVNDRRVLNGIFWVLRTGAPWRALPDEFRPPTTDVLPIFSSGMNASFPVL
jgi:transposase